MCMLVVIQAEQYHGVVRLSEKQVAEELRLEGASGDDLVQLLFAEQNLLEQVAQDHMQLDFEAGSQCLNLAFESPEEFPWK